VKFLKHMFLISYSEILTIKAGGKYSKTEPETLKYFFYWLEQILVFDRQRGEQT